MRVWISVSKGRMCGTVSVKLSVHLWLMVQCMKEESVQRVFGKVVPWAVMIEVV